LVIRIIANAVQLIIEKEREKLFSKIEPYLTYLDYNVLERKTKLSEKDKQIETLMKKQEQFEQLLQSVIDSGQLKSVKVEN
jgi:hypothetical protein